MVDDRWPAFNASHRPFAPETYHRLSTSQVDAKMVTTQPQLIRTPDAGEAPVSFSRHSLLAYGRLRARTPSGGSGPLRRACAPFAAKAAQGCRRQTPAAARGYALLWRSGLRPSLVQGLRPRNAPVQNQSRRGASVCVIAPITPRQPIRRRDPSITPITQIPPPRRQHQLSVASGQ